MAILHQFPFSSSLQRMTVIVQEMGGDQLAFMKGAPEKVASFCQPETGECTDLYYSWLTCISSPNMAPQHLTCESNHLLIIASRMTHLYPKLNTKIKIIFPTSYIFHPGEWYYHSPTSWNLRSLLELSLFLRASVLAIANPWRCHPIGSGPHRPSTGSL